MARLISQRKYFYLFFLFTSIFRYTWGVKSVYAHCTLCVAGAGAGLTLSRLLGIDDSITGVWVGAVLGASSFWLQKALGRKHKMFFSVSWGLVIYLLVFASTLWSFYKFNLIVKHGDIFGMDKLTFGMIGGGVLFYLVDVVNDLLIKKNGKSFFPYQRLTVGLGSMVLLSFSVYVLINFYL